MPYVQISPEDLVVGQEYVLTRKGMALENTNAKASKVVIPPTSKKALEDAYKGLIKYENTMPHKEIKETDYLMRAFFSGNRNTGLVFSQHRSFGSNKPVEYVTINANEKGGANGNTLVYHRLSADNWAFWQLMGNNSTRRNNKNGANYTRKLMGGNPSAFTAAEKRAIKAKAVERTKAHKEAQAERTAALGTKFGMTFAFPASITKKKGGNPSAFTAAEKRAIKAKAVERTKAHKEAQAERTAALGAKFGMTFAFPASITKKK